MPDDDPCAFCGESTKECGPSELVPVTVTDAQGRETRRPAHVLCANAVAVAPPFTGYCEDCGAKHGVEDEVTSCMCGGRIHPVSVLDTVSVTVNGDEVAVPTTLPPTPACLLEAAGFDPREHHLYRKDVAGECTEPLVVDDGDAFTTLTAEG